MRLTLPSSSFQKQQELLSIGKKEPQLLHANQELHFCCGPMRPSASRITVQGSAQAGPPAFARTESQRPRVRSWRMPWPQAALDPAAPSRNWMPQPCAKKNMCFWYLMRKKRTNLGTGCKTSSSPFSGSHKNRRTKIHPIFCAKQDKQKRTQCLPRKTLRGSACRSSSSRAVSKEGP